MLALPTYSFRHVERSAVLDERVRELVQRLQRINERIDHCHLTFGRRQDDVGGSPPYEVQIDLSVPGAQIHAHSASATSPDPDDVFTALNAAFDDAGRQLLALHRERIGTSKAR